MPIIKQAVLILGRLHTFDGGGECGSRGYRAAADRAPRGRERRVGVWQHAAHVRLRRRTRGVRPRAARERRQRRGPQRERTHAAHGGMNLYLIMDFKFLKAK